MVNEEFSGLRINTSRLWQSLMTMAEIGATAKGGCNRQALTDEDKQGRDLFVQWCKDAGCSIKIDAMGNVFARRAGKNNALAPVIAGSHLDTQPTGGKFDGVYGVLSALEVIRALNDANVETEASIEAVCWTNEEGARFSPAMIGSGVWVGEFDLAYGHSRIDKEGNTLAGELKRIGYLGNEECKAAAIKAAFEVHIEQGPILENEKLQIGVLTGAQGMRWYDLIIEGQPCHAGPTPMEVRRDPVMGLHRILAKLYKLAEDNAPWARMTFGDLKAEPGSRNTVPEKVIVTIDVRHPDELVLNDIDKSLRSIVSEECAALKLDGQVNDEWISPSVKFDDSCIASVQNAVDLLGYSNMQMVSGAGHDSVYVSRVAPTSMIFVPCEKGLSHNEEENAKQEDLEAGCNVLLHAMLEQANS
jgi:beta-ureidopropionase / N-carbamoyl-L-amino-acid hydrolase